MVTKSISLYQEVARQELDRMNQLVFGWESLMEDEKIHIANVAASVMMTRDGFLTGGSFVTSIIKNDLETAILRADTQVSKAIRFMVWAKRDLFLERIHVMERVETNS